MVDQVSRVRPAGASAGWGRGHGFQIFNSPGLSSVPGDPRCVGIVRMGWEPQPPGQTGTRLALGAGLGLRPGILRGHCLGRHGFSGGFIGGHGWMAAACNWSA
jgi:hypothetical protein